jgi:superfamily II DNA or RNA helicase
MSDRQNNKYVDLKTNGRLFPTFVMANFKKYKVPDVFTFPDEDPCSRNKTELKLREYQIFLSKYLDYRSPFRDILVYHGLGSGKTTSAINIYNMLYNYTPGWNVFVLIKATLKNHPWMVDLNQWMQKDEFEHRFKNIIFVSYDYI